MWPLSWRERAKPGGQSHVREGEGGTGQLHRTARAVGEHHCLLLSSQWGQRNLSGSAYYRTGRKRVVEGKESQISNGGGGPGRL